MTLTQIQDTMLDAAGNLISTELSITPTVAFTAPDGSAVEKQTVSYQVSLGVLNLGLAPTIGATPSGVSYHVAYQLPDGNRIQEFWSVAQSGSPLTLAQVRVPQTPIQPRLPISFTQISGFLASYGFTSQTGTGTLASGQNDLIDPVASGLKTTMNVTVLNPTGSSITCVAQLKDTNGVYHTIPEGQTTIGAGQSQLFRFQGIVLAAGETFSFNCSASGCTFIATINSFNATAPVSTLKTYSLGSGTTLLYTATAFAIVVAPTQFGGIGSGCGLANLSGVAQSNVEVLYTPSGGSALVLALSVSLSDQNATLLYGPLTLGGGDSISVSCPGTDDWAWLTLIGVA